MKTVAEKSVEQQELEMLQRRIEEEFGKVGERVGNLEAGQRAMQEAQITPPQEKAGWEPWKREDYPQWCQGEEWFVVTPKTDDSHGMVTKFGHLIIPRRKHIPMIVPKSIMESMLETNSVIPGGVIEQKEEV